MPDPDAQNPPPTCASCGTDISGLSREDRCPNCGVKIAHLGDMPAPANPPLIPLHAPTDGTIEQELDPLTCPRCKYDRVSLPRGAPCPECGKVPGVPDNFPVYQPLTQARRIEHAIGCSNCGYNLRGLMSDGTCPECGSAIAPSLRPAYLRLSPPEALKRINSSLLLLIWAVIAAWAVIAFGGVLSAFVIRKTSREGPEVLRSILTFGCIAVFSVGAWLLSEPDFKGRSGRGARKGTLGHSQRLRRIFARVAAVAAPAGGLAWILVVVLRLGRPDIVEIARGVVWLGLAGLTATTASMVHILAYRSDNPRLNKTARVAEGTCGALFALEIVLLIAALLISRLGGSTIGCLVIARLFAVVAVSLLIGAMIELRQQVSAYLQAPESSGSASN